MMGVGRCPVWVVSDPPCDVRTCAWVASGNSHVLYGAITLACTPLIPLRRKSKTTLLSVCARHVPFILQAPRKLRRDHLGGCQEALFCHSLKRARSQASLVTAALSSGAHEHRGAFRSSRRFSRSWRFSLTSRTRTDTGTKRQVRAARDT